MFAGADCGAGLRSVRHDIGREPPAGRDVRQLCREAVRRLIHRDPTSAPTKCGPVLHFDEPGQDDEVLEPPASTSLIVVTALRQRDQCRDGGRGRAGTASLHRTGVVDANAWESLTATVIEPILARALGNGLVCRAAEALDARPWVVAA